MLSTLLLAVQSIGSTPL